MDYNKFEDDIYNIYKEKIIINFKNNSKIKRPFPNALDKAIVYIYNIKKDGVIYNNLQLLDKCTSLINHRLDYYDEEVALNSIILNEIKVEFEKVKDKIVDLENSKLEIHYEDFIKELIKYDCFSRIEKRLSLNSELFKLFYDNDNYRGFNLDFIEEHVVNSLLYKRIFSKFYPNKPIPIAVRVEGQYSSFYKIEIPNKKDNTKSLSSLPSFNDDDKCMILHLCLVDKYNIPLTEKIKLISLIGAFENYSIIHEKSNSNVIYKKINEGSERNGSKNTMKKTLQNIIVNIEAFDLNKTKETLLYLKNKLN